MSSEYIYDSTASPAANQFMHVRWEVWLEALGPEPHGTLAGTRHDLPGWPRLFAFHCFCAAVMVAISQAPNEPTPLGEDFQAWLDQWQPLSVLSATPSMSSRNTRSRPKKIEPGRFHPAELNASNAQAHPARRQTPTY